jgi:hypothetical protein
MRNEAVMQQEQRREAAQAALRETSRAATKDVQREVRQDAAQGREVMSAASREVGRRGDNLAEDAREAFGPEAGAAVEKWRDRAREALDRTQQAASSFFRLLEASLESAGRQDERLTEVSGGAARALEAFAAEMDRQSAAVLRAVTDALDQNREQDAHQALERSTEQTDRASETFDRERERFEAQIDAARVDQQRREQQLDDERRRDRERQERDAHDR